MNNTNKLTKFLNLIKKTDSLLEFQIIEIGAHPYEGKEEPFYQILDYFPKSKIYAFEINENECDKLNNSSKSGVKYFPYALGQKDEEIKFYETKHPMCSSTYEPNEELLKIYNNLEVASLKGISKIKTTSLDRFLKKEKINSIDFIKIDIQGGEMNVFKGARESLKNTLMVISEVEFIPIYKNQPLFGDINSFLNKEDLIFHKFLGLAGRCLSPIILNKNKNFATQHIWSDAIFIKNILNLKKLDKSQLLKSAVFCFLYGSPDFTFHYLLAYDKLEKTNLVDEFKNI